jgi:hypothetical protein
MGYLDVLIISHCVHTCTRPEFNSGHTLKRVVSYLNYDTLCRIVLNFRTWFRKKYAVRPNNARCMKLFLWITLNFRVKTQRYTIPALWSKTICLYFRYFYTFTPRNPTKYHRLFDFLPHRIPLRVLERSKSPHSACVGTRHTIVIRW